MVKALEIVRFQIKKCSAVAIRHAEMSAKSPCWEQTEDGIKRWLLENVRVGERVVVRTIKGSSLRYELGRIIRLERGRFAVAKSQSAGLVDSSWSFYYSGRSCKNPRGSVRLVIPTPEVLEACAICVETGGFLPGSYVCSFR